MDQNEPSPDFARIIATFEAVPHCRDLDLQLVDLRPGEAFMALPYDSRLIGNPETGVIHGGALTTLLDTLCGLAVMSAVTDGTPVATLDLRIDYLKPATPRTTVLASALCYKRTPSVAFVRGMAYHDHQGDPIATCVGTFMLGGGGFSAGGSPAGGGAR